MLSNSASDREAILAAYDELDAAFDKVLGHSLDVLTHSELLTLQSRMERNLRRAPAVEHRILNRLATEASPTALGGTSLADVLATRLRISKGEARRRIEDAEKLGARTALTGEPLEPLWPNTAAAQARDCVARQGRAGNPCLRVGSQTPWSSCWRSASWSASRPSCCTRRASERSPEEARRLAFRREVNGARAFKAGHPVAVSIEFLAVARIPLKQRGRAIGYCLLATTVWVC
jgi:hypothetical protein